MALHRFWASPETMLSGREGYERLSRTSPLLPEALVFCCCRISDRGVCIGYAPRCNVQMLTYFCIKYWVDIIGLWHSKGSIAMGFAIFTLVGLKKWLRLIGKLWIVVCSVLCVCVLLRVCVLLLCQDWCQLVHTLVEASPSWTAHLQVQTSASHSHTPILTHSLLQNSLLLNSKW